MAQYRAQNVGGSTGGSSSRNLTQILKYELERLEGIQSQNPETGSGIGSGTHYVNQYTNRLFGAPFQLIDSVDKRFPDVNTHVGNEYLRNFLLNAPILRLKPGMPKYTGGAKSKDLVEAIKSTYLAAAGGMPTVEAMLMEFAQDTVFSKGKKLQRRMFGFRETYWDYMSYVNYMCRSTAKFLQLTDTQRYPTGTFVGDNFTSLAKFENMQWQKYRMLSSSKPMTPTQQLGNMVSATYLGAAGKTAGAAISEIGKFIGSSASSVSQALNGANDSETSFGDLVNSVKNAASQAASNISDAATRAFSGADNTTLVDVMEDKISSVMFMVEPVQFEETLTNSAEQSVIAQKVDSKRSELGEEIAFITGSKVDTGILDNMASFLGDTVQTASQFLGGLVSPIAGGFASNLFSGAIQSIKGQKMIYPKIYKDSSSTMDYTFTVNLVSPYGDVYNYYMNIVVPLLHLIAFAAPRMISSNAVASPFMVQAYIPGMCTCQLGMISNMQIIKNKSRKRVSVNGYPLEVTVTFQVQELYNAMSISPANDPASFLFNETLNDYMANLAGLSPSLNTYLQQRISAFQSLENYFTGGDEGYENSEVVQDVANKVLEGWEDTVNPFVSA